MSDQQLLIASAGKREPHVHHTVHGGNRCDICFELIHEPVWCLSFWEPIVSLSEWWHDRYPWRRLWLSYCVLPHGALSAYWEK